MSQQFNLQGFEEFKTPRLPDSFEKGLDLLQNYGVSAFQQTKDLLGNARNSVKAAVPGLTQDNSSINNETYIDTTPAVDFKSISNDNGDFIVFGGLLPLDGFYTKEYKSACEPGQYDSEIQEQLNNIKEQQQLMKHLFKETGALLNFNQEQSGIFIRKNLTASCVPSLEKTKPKSSKIGEKCLRDTDCITSSSENKPHCKKAIRDKYLTGICNEIIKREGKKCNATADCKNQALECVNKKCTRKVNRVSNSSSSSSNTRKAPRVNTDIPIQKFKGLGIKTPNPQYDSYYTSPYGSYGGYTY